MAIEQHTTITTDDCLSTSGGVVNGELGLGGFTQQLSNPIKFYNTNNKLLGQIQAAELDGYKQISIGSGRLVGITDVVDIYDAVNKTYVDTAISNINIPSNDVSFGIEKIYGSVDGTQTTYYNFSAQLIKNDATADFSNYVYHITGCGVTLGPNSIDLTLNTQMLLYGYTNRNVDIYMGGDYEAPSFYYTYGSTTARSTMNVQSNGSIKISGLQGLFVGDFIISCTKT